MRASLLLLGSLFLLSVTANAQGSVALQKQQAYWLDRSRVAIQPAFFDSGNTYAICWGQDGSQQIPLQTGGSLTQDELAHYPQLAKYAVLTVPASVPVDTIKQALKGQLALASVSKTGELTYSTGIQHFGVLDDLYFYPGQLGAVFGNGGVELRLWAPTAQSVSLLLYDHGGDAEPGQTVAMTEQNGVWTARGKSDWSGKYYLYSAKVYVPSEQKVVENLASDPYSVDLSLNGTRSRITNLDAPQTKPPQWDRSSSPVLAKLNDLSLYELHVRDFSIGDATVPAEHRGMYAAFSDGNSDGMRHLRALAQAGLKAVHLLPTFHFGSVNEDKSQWKTTGDLSRFPPGSDQQAAEVAKITRSDGYNWGYDPVHYMAPQGSYAMNPDNRVYEYRAMVQSLHSAGLRVVQDVVFNHTSSNGQAASSNLDRLVPLYYHRLDPNGKLYTSSCCSNTASEHRMMEKLMIDTMVGNARHYKIDGYRFDLMGLHFVYNMQHIKEALAKLTLAKDGVDGTKIYLYGEGWDFGELAKSAFGPNAAQVNLYGSGVGSFNDRMRDSIRGGGPGVNQTQGFATGLLTDASEFTKQSMSGDAQLQALLQEQDLIRVSLTGNLRDYKLIDHTGQTVTGAEVKYNRNPGGYTASPVEAINYCSVHDNLDLFDAVQLKANASDSAAVRARRQVLALSLVQLGQGVPLFHAGDDMLRSKSLDENSYDSGDWYNKIDWSGKGNNWGIGLPLRAGNRAALLKTTLENPTCAPTPADISYAASAFQEFLQIRYSSELFRMTTLEEIQKNLTFLSAAPGVIVMKLDSRIQHILVVFNATSGPVNINDDRLKGLKLSLHPVQGKSSDPIVRQSHFDSAAGAATVPGLTTAVFVSKQN